MFVARTIPDLSTLSERFSLVRDDECAVPQQFPLWRSQTSSSHFVLHQVLISIHFLCVVSKKQHTNEWKKMAVPTQVSEVAVTVPLTTVFTRPTDCATHWTYEGSQFNSISNGIMIQNVLSNYPDRSCFPSGWGVFGRVNTVQVYSPGTCPFQYTTPAVYENNGTTTALCCSS